MSSKCEDKDDVLESDGSGSEHETEGLQQQQQPPKRKHYLRLTARQIQEMEALFEECPHPDRKQRHRLSQDLGLEPRGVKLWFRKRRAQMKEENLMSSKSKDDISGSEHADGIAENEQETQELQQQPKRKRYHRHTARQIQETEGVFKECPHHNDKQRLGSGKEKGRGNLCAFYQPYLPQYHKKRARIPLAYMRYMEGKLPDRAFLKDSWGNAWCVKIGEFQGETHFLDGWTQFIQQNQVEPCDLIVFQFDGSHTFYVRLLGHSRQCDSEGVGHLIHQVREERKKEIDGESEPERESENDNGQTHPCKKPRAKVVNRFGHELFRIRRITPPNNPYFVTKISRRRPNQLLVPGPFIKANRNTIVDLPEAVIICDASDRKWPSSLKRWADGRVFYEGGWAEFRRVNLVQEDDHCICEFVTFGDGSTQIRVEIVRGSLRG